MTVSKNLVTPASVAMPSLKFIKFEDVSFSYPEGRLVLENINFTLKKGDHLAIVGENGAGKSTLIKLLCRLYSPTSGKITCNDTDIADIDINIWRKQLTAVFQDFGHYNLSISENVTFLNNLDPAGKNDFIYACEKAQFKFSEMTDENTLLGKEYGGTDLSGGQWQRLALARALFSSGDLIILDEPTSAMDPRVEAEIFATFAELVDRKTSVMVTHRLAAVKNASTLIVLKKGKIVESGTPADLERAKGEYYELLSLQRRQFGRNYSADESL